MLTLSALLLFAATLPESATSSVTADLPPGDTPKLYTPEPEALPAPLAEPSPLAQLALEPPRAHELSIAVDTLLDPGSKSGSFALVQTVMPTIQLSFSGFFVALEFAGAITEVFGDWSAVIFLLGNPSLRLGYRWEAGPFYARFGVGFTAPIVSLDGDLSIEDGHAYAAAASARGGANTWRWARPLLALTALELGVAQEQWSAGLKVSTAVAPSDPDFGGDLSVRGAYHPIEIVAIGGELGLGGYELQIPRSNVVRVCIADTPEQCTGDGGGAGPAAAPRFELSGPVLRLSPYVSVDVGVRLLISWTVLLAGPSNVEGLRGRHEFGLALSRSF